MYIHLSGTQRSHADSRSVTTDPRVPYTYRVSSHSTSNLVSPICLYVGIFIVLSIAFIDTLFCSAFKAARLKVWIFYCRHACSFSFLPYTHLKWASGYWDIGWTSKMHSNILRNFSHKVIYADDILLFTPYWPGKIVARMRTWAGWICQSILRSLAVYALVPVATSGVLK